MSEIGGSARAARPALLSAALVVLAACSAGASDASTLPDAGLSSAADVGADSPSADGAAPATEAPSTAAEAAETRRRTPVRAGDDEIVSTSTVTPTTSPPSTSPPTTVPPSTTTTEPPIDAAHPDCVVRATADTALESAVRGLVATPPAAAPATDAASDTEGVTEDAESTTETDSEDVPVHLDIVGLWAENDFADTVTAGDLIDICVGNGRDDIDGGTLEVTEADIDTALSATVERQQSRLNELFADLGTGDIAVDGQSGDRTGQRLCGARLALGLTPSMADMLPGTAEQATLFATESLPTPFDHDADDERWILIDRTCQLLFAGTGSNMVYAFPTSTGEEGFETRLQDRARAIRFNPAVENGGWHDSSEFPVGVDNPLNGNMYKPLYFDLGQAIHGATHVPPVPDSKGCARLRVGDHNRLLEWIGLSDAQEETWRREDLTIEVSVQGDFIDR